MKQKVYVVQSQTIIIPCDTKHYLTKGIFSADPDHNNTGITMKQPVYLV